MGHTHMEVRRKGIDINRKTTSGVSVTIVFPSAQLSSVSDERVCVSVCVCVCIHFFSLVFFVCMRMFKSTSTVD